jgi:hypothetical protein
MVWAALVQQGKVMPVVMAVAARLIILVVGEAALVALEKLKQLQTPEKAALAELVSNQTLTVITITTLAVAVAVGLYLETAAEMVG